jgi:hypothetical protein
MRQLGALHVTAWQVFTTTPAVLLVVGVIAGGLALLTLAGNAVGLSRVVVWAGAVGLLFGLYRLEFRPGSGDFLEIGWGLYLALGATASIIAGGLLAGAEHTIALMPQTADWVNQTAPAPAPSTVNSVPPPRAR